MKHKLIAFKIQKEEAGKQPSIEGLLEQLKRGQSPALELFRLAGVPIATNLIRLRLQDGRLKETLTEAVGKNDLAEQLGIEMINLPAGHFIFQRRTGVAFQGCKMAKTPFTNGQFRKLMKLKAHELAQIVANPEERLTRSLSKVHREYQGEAEDCPMVYISQPEAEGIARLLGKRLPTELERERAAAYTDGRKYPFGDQFDKSKVTFETQGTRSVYAHPKGASPEGILDLSGNAWEWTATPYGDTDFTDRENPILPTAGTNYSLRGGSWNNTCTDFLQSGCRDGGRPGGLKSPDIGFRLAED